MTTTATAPALTVEHFLLGETAGGPDALAQRLRSISGALDAGLALLNPAGREVVAASLATVARGLLSADLADILISGWRTHTALAEAARASAAHPAAEHVVDLATHRVTYQQRPTIEVLVDGGPVAQVHLELLLVFQVTGLAAVLRGGRLVALRSGRGELVASLTAEGVCLAERRADLDLNLLIRLGPGVPLQGPGR